MKTLVTLLSLIFASHSTVLNQFTAGNHLLSAALYKEVGKNDGNFLVSPLSLEAVFALTASGALGATAEELTGALHLPTRGTPEALRSLLPELTSTNYTLISANKIYIQEGFDIHEDFKAVTAEDYRSEIESINFDQKAEAAKEINRWVGEKTRGRIGDIVSQADLGGTTGLLLINALYFKGNWSIAFPPTATKADKFYPKDGKVLEVPTMHGVATHNYYESSDLDAKFLELQYQGKEASLVVVLPNKRDGISYLESKIDEVFSTPSRNFVPEKVNISLPKFRVETTIDLVGALKNLGVRKVFDAEEADLSGIAGKKGDLAVGAVKQKTFIEVREEGAEAAATTVAHVGFHLTPSLLVPVETKQFVADHPFLFYIKLKDVVLFGGRVAAP